MHVRNIALSVIWLRDELKKATSVHWRSGNHVITKHKRYQLPDTNIVWGIGTGGRRRSQPLRNFLCAQLAKDRIIAATKVRKDWWLIVTWCFILHYLDELFSIVVGWLSYPLQQVQHAVLPTRDACMEPFLSEDVGKRKASICWSHPITF